MRDYVPPLPAAESGASVLLLERAPEPQAGGNSRFTAGVFRFCHEGAHDIRRLVPDLSDAEAARILFGTYSAEQYFEDLFSVTRFRARLDMAEPISRAIARGHVLASINRGSLRTFARAPRCTRQRENAFPRGLGS